jgi:predicted metalloprotease with PDZ domain
MMHPQGAVRSLLASALVTLSLPCGDHAEAAEPMSLHVDAREAPRRILHARLRVPAAPGPLVLLYPRWIPGEHGPTGRVNDLVGLQVTAGGRALPFTRDPLDLHAFKIEVPGGVSALEVAYDFVSATGGRGAAAEAFSSAQLLLLKWQHVALYPRGTPILELPVEASVTLPPQWSFATALPLRRQAREGTSLRAEFRAVSLETLVDSPLHAGRFGRTIDLAQAGQKGPPLALNVFADSAEALDAPARTLDAFRDLFGEAHALFGARPFRRYDFLLALSDHVPHGGLEHHESSDNRLPERALVDEGWRMVRAGLLPHELVHSWNGKHRRPADLIAPDFQRPVKTGLLWVYEGLTSYLGEVLTTRSGLRSVEASREAWAAVAAQLVGRTGRTWRSLGDTATAAPALGRAVREWRTWRRGLDYYPESQLVWLEADVLIRQLSSGARSLDDFCKAFHGRADGAPSVVPYDRDELMAALTKLAPHDWRRFFAERMDAVAPRAPLAGLEAAGWRLVHREAPTAFTKASEQTAQEVDLLDSIGLLLSDDGAVIDVRPGSAAALAGLGPSMKLIAAGGRRFTSERLRAAVARTAKTPDFDLIVESADAITVHHVRYRGGHRYPALERIAGRPDLLGEILRPRLAPAP